LTAGQLTVASDLSYPPQEYLDPNGKPAGFDIDLAAAIASHLGLRLKVENINVSGILSGFAVRDRRYDMGISAQPDSASIQASAATLPYFVSGQSILVRSADKKTKALADLCGLKVGSNKSQSGEEAVLLENDNTCRARPMKYTAYEQDAKGLKDVSAGRLDAFVDDYPVASFLRGQYGLRVVPHQFSTSKDVMVFPQDGVALRDAVAAAFQRLRDNGSYRRLLKLWSLEEGELK